MIMMRFCPFCVGTPDSKLHPAADELAGYRKLATVRCRTCGASVSAGSEQDKNGWIKEGETGMVVVDRAVAKWNRRESDAQNSA